MNFPQTPSYLIKSTKSVDYGKIDMKFPTEKIWQISTSVGCFTEIWSQFRDANVGCLADFSEMSQKLFDALS